VALALFLFTRRLKRPFLSMTDLVAPVAPIGLFFGRIANFINGELWGRPTSLPWGIVFPAGGPAPRHPSQLYEACLEGLALFLLLRLATHRLMWLRRRGAVSGLFLAGYAVFRIALENVREPDSFMPHFPLGLTMGMMLSTPMLLVGLWLIWRSREEAPATQPSTEADAAA
jgi:phosphatidylglycerol:prolipoprotein diacylglycerol transferase